MSGFLKLLWCGHWYAYLCVYVCVFVCVPTPEAIKNYSREIKPEQLITNQTSPTALQFAYMALSIDLTDGCGLNNEVHHYLMLKKSYVMLYLPFISQ